MYASCWVHSNARTRDQQQLQLVDPAALPTARTFPFQVPNPFFFCAKTMHPSIMHLCTPFSLQVLRQVGSREIDAHVLVLFVCSARAKSQFRM